MMVASHLGYSIGKFSHYVNNLHIYDRHEPAMFEILERTPLNQQPKIELLNNKNFYDFTIDDFKISNIEGIQKIKSPLELAI
jgi:thymidylate synthase